MKVFRTLAMASLMGLSTAAMAAAPANAAQCRDAKGHFTKCDAKAKPKAAAHHAVKSTTAKPRKTATSPAG